MTAGRFVVRFDDVEASAEVSDDHVESLVKSHQVDSPYRYRCHVGG